MSLLDVPNEILHEFIRYAPHEDRFNMRYLCRALAEIGKKYIAPHKLVVESHPQLFERIEHIASDSIFRESVTEVVLGYYPLRWHVRKSQDDYGASWAAEISVPPQEEFDCSFERYINERNSIRNFMHDDQDIVRFERALRKLPNIQHLSIKEINMRQPANLLGIEWGESAHPLEFFNTMTILVWFFDAL